MGSQFPFRFEIFIPDNPAKFRTKRGFTSKIEKLNGRIRDPYSPDYTQIPKNNLVRGQSTFKQSDRYTPVWSVVTYRSSRESTSRRLVGRRRS